MMRVCDRSDISREGASGMTAGLGIDTGLVTLAFEVRA